MIAGDITPCRVNSRRRCLLILSTPRVPVLARRAFAAHGLDGKNVHVWKRMPLDENYFGLGDKAGRMNRRNRYLTMWNTDEFGLAGIQRSAVQRTFRFIGLRKWRRLTDIFRQCLSQQF